MPRIPIGKIGPGAQGQGRLGPGPGFARSTARAGANVAAGLNQLAGVLESIGEKRIEINKKERTNERTLAFTQAIDALDLSMNEVPADQVVDTYELQSKALVQQHLDAIPDADERASFEARIQPAVRTHTGAMRKKSWQRMGVQIMDTIKATRGTQMLNYANAEDQAGRDLALEEMANLLLDQDPNIILPEVAEAMMKEFETSSEALRFDQMDAVSPAAAFAAWHDGEFPGLSDEKNAEIQDKGAEKARKALGNEALMDGDTQIERGNYAAFPGILARNARLREDEAITPAQERSQKAEMERARGVGQQKKDDLVLFNDAMSGKVRMNLRPHDQQVKRMSNLFWTDVAKASFERANTGSEQDRERFTNEIIKFSDAFGVFPIPFVDRVSGMITNFKGDEQGTAQLEDVKRGLDYYKTIRGERPFAIHQFGDPTTRSVAGHALRLMETATDQDDAIRKAARNAFPADPFKQDLIDAQMAAEQEVEFENNREYLSQQEILGADPGRFGFTFGGEIDAESLPFGMTNYFHALYEEHRRTGASPDAARDGAFEKFRQQWVRTGWGSAEGISFRPPQAAYHVPGEYEQPQMMEHLAHILGADETQIPGVLFEPTARTRHEAQPTYSVFKPDGTPLMVDNQQVEWTPSHAEYVRDVLNPRLAEEEKQQIEVLESVPETEPIQHEIENTEAARELQRNDFGFSYDTTIDVMAARSRAQAEAIDILVHEFRPLGDAGSVMAADLVRLKNRAAKLLGATGSAGKRAAGELSDSGVAGSAADAAVDAAKDLAALPGRGKDAAAQAVLEEILSGVADAQ